MPAQRPPTDEELAALRDQLRAEIRTAHETLKDLRTETREARDLLPLLTDELFSAEVKKQVDKLGEATARAMTAATDRVFASFDKLYNTLTGQDPQSRRAGEPTVPDLIARHVGADAGPDEADGP